MCGVLFSAFWLPGEVCNDLSREESVRIGLGEVCYDLSQVKSVTICPG